MDATRKKNKVVTIILVLAFLSISLPIVAGTFSSAASVTYTSAAPTAGGFYDGLGTIYTVKTLDDIGIKVLRYHPVGKSFNTGKQPVLILPGMACNINTYLSHVTSRIKEKYPGIANDALDKYSLALYLYNNGYDVWLLNYRGVGLDEMKSETGDVERSTIDVFAMYDARAGLNLVYQVTGKHPVVGGHSTGGTVFMMLLEGCYFQWNGHIGTSSSLAKQRNGNTQGAETIKGFIGLEPAGIPIVTDLLDWTLIWAILDSGISLDLRGLCESLDGDILNVNTFLGGLQGLISDTALGTIVGNYLNIDSSNCGDLLTYYLLRYVVDTMYISMVGQYADWAWHQTIREYYENGLFNDAIINPPAPSWLDGYYYYIDHVDHWKVPSLFVLAPMQNEVFDLVDKDAIIRDYVDGKTTNAKDRVVVTSKGAHIDIPFGECAPTEIFPAIKTFLASIA